MAKYDQMVKDYMLSVSRGQPDGQQLSQAAKQLQSSIDQAMRAAAGSAQPATPAATGPAASGTNPPSF
jgi:hypothetical protein